MVRIAAAPDAAQVIEDETGRNRLPKCFERNSMRELATLTSVELYPYDAITVLIDAICPNPTAVGINGYRSSDSLAMWRG